MSSLLCVQQGGGTMRIHSQKLYRELSPPTLAVEKSDLTASRRRIAGSIPTIPVDIPPTPQMDSKGVITQTIKIQDWLSEKAVKELQERFDSEAISVRKLYVPLLEAEDTFVKDLYNSLENKQIFELRKKELLHKNWMDRVYEPLRKQIVEVMDGCDWPKLDRRKRQLHKQYLEFVNEKGHVFLDTMDPREYYAQALNGHRPSPITVEMEAFNDPLLSQKRERHEEDRTILRCQTGTRYTDRDLDQVKLPLLPLAPLGRHGVDCCRWLQMPLVNIESTSRQKSSKFGIRSHDMHAKIFFHKCY